MLDKTVEFHQVLMVKKNDGIYPRFDLPEGFAFCNYEPGMEEIWCDLHYRVDHFDSMEQARQVFETEFLPRPQELLQKCVFVRDSEGRFAGTASIWPGDDFGSELQRVHWVAVSEQYQGLGLAKALLTRVLDIYSELGYKDEFLYLISSTWSYKALNIYKKFGFVPYLGEKPVNFKGENFEENERAWEIVDRMLSKR